MELRKEERAIVEEKSVPPPEREGRTNDKPFEVAQQPLRCWRGPTPKYNHLLSDQDIRRWYDNVCRGSKITADVYLRRLGFLCSARGMYNPKELIEHIAENGERWAYNFLVDIVTQLEREGKAGSYIESNIKAVKSWLAHNGIEVKGKVKIRGATDTPTLRNKHALSNSELALFLSNAPPQTRCAAVLVAEAGLRPESVGSYEGADGLRIADFPEIKISQCSEHLKGSSEAADGDELGSCECRVTFSRIPTMVIVRQEISKARHQYFTFLTAEGCRYLSEYLTQRMRSGERLESSKAVVAPANYRPRRNAFVRTTLLGDLIRKRLRACAVDARPYDLRCTFATLLMLAESRGAIIRDYRVFFMGHKGDIEHRYTTNKRTLPSEVVEDMRTSFARAQRYLQSEGTISDERDMRHEMRKQLLLAAGFNDEEVSKMDISSMGSEELHGAIKRKLLGVMANNGSKQKVVAVSEVEGYISNGWEFVAALPNDRAVVKVPF